MMEYIQWFVSATTDFVTEEAKQGGPQDLLPNIKKALSERVSCVLFTLRVFPAVGNIMLPGIAAKFSVSEVKGYQDESIEEVLKASHTSTVPIYPHGQTHSHRTHQFNMPTKRRRKLETACFNI
jgi:hypothetical protein